MPPSVELLGPTDFQFSSPDPRPPVFKPASAPGCLCFSRFSSAVLDVGVSTVVYLLLQLFYLLLQLFVVVPLFLWLFTCFYGCVFVWVDQYL